MSKQTVYRCVCGKEFQIANQFNGHKAHCKEHLTLKGKYEELSQLYKAGAKKSNQKRIEKYKLSRQENLKKWIAEQHQCETCGKVMTEKYGSGRFCCRSCANTRRHSEETKQKIALRSSQQLLINIENNTLRANQLNYTKYLENPKYCPICNLIIPYSRRMYKTCGNPDCLHSIRVQKSLQMRQNKGIWKTVKSQYKFGTYKGYECDSSWELAFLLYYLDQGYAVLRNYQGFKYVYKEQVKTFFPDFIIDGVFYEIKGKVTDQVAAKVSQFPENQQLVLLTNKEMQPILKYCRQTYGRDFAETLYDADKPNWTQSEQYKHYINRKYQYKQK